MSRNGFSLLDDSNSHVLLEDGWIKSRKKGGKDLYFWGYGHDYKEAVADLIRLCGKTKEIEKLRVKNTHDKVKSIVGVADDNKQGGLAVAYGVKLHFVGFHKLPQLLK